MFTRQQLAAFYDLCGFKYMPMVQYSLLIGLLAPLTDASVELSVLSLQAAVKAMLFVAACQVTAELTNNFFDYEGDLLNSKRTEWNGGSNALVQGILSLRVAIWGALLLSVATVTTILLEIALDPTSVFWQPWIIRLMIIGMFSVWQYAGPPFRLQYNGFGEFVTASVEGIFVPMMGAVIVNPHGDDLVLPSVLNWQLFSLLFTVFFIKTVTKNIPDIEADLQVNKNTFTSRIGISNAASLFILGQNYLIIGPVLYCLTGVMHPIMSAAFLVLAPRANAVAAKMWKYDSTRCDKLLAQLPGDCVAQCMAVQTTVLASTIAMIVLS
ncbi:hypothetical protein Poli38472_010045 [Pythium oligandrum]|uniref:1,4-dihydroxy-2-naphthoate octaprenyltransferase n=1 Tax=Pythium oligandrum TaxID=41045 RepID=A0A8K1FDL2_PYTOL|nr:hypothetical protein Poli38472_010045 [Pythium oligandrum]|eukprot:TMW58486.1 hypothetical protein Poli38472_010045 [Pythium oligandrum]